MCKLHLADNLASTESLVYLDQLTFRWFTRFNLLLQLFYLAVSLGLSGFLGRFT